MKNQLVVWDTLLEWRIRIQKLLLAANRLPQPGSEAGRLLQDPSLVGGKVAQIQGQTRKSITKLIEVLSELEKNLIETGALPVKRLKTCLGSNDHEKDGDVDDDEEIPSGDDEEIPSDDEGMKDMDMEDQEDSDELDLNNDNTDEDEDGDEGDDDNEDQVEPKQPGKKRKIETMDGSNDSDELEDRFNSFKSFRNDILDDWYQKTRFSTAVKGSSKESVERPPTVQIQTIVSDKTRLLRRTQLKRSDYKVIGRNEVEEDADQEIARTDGRSDNFDPEIFDDDDFYHQLLRELIATKTEEGADSLAMSKKWMEIQKMRANMKKRNLTGSSKGRIIKFETHKQLVNFMAPVESFEFTDQDKDQFFDSLFQ